MNRKIFQAFLFAEILFFTLEKQPVNENITFKLNLTLFYLLLIVLNTFYRI